MSDSLPARIAARIIADYIERGAANHGDRLPSFRRLKEVYNTSHSTLANALSILESSGRIQRFHGKGTFIRRESPALAAAGPPANGSKPIAYIIPTGNASDFPMRLFAGIEEACRNLGRTVILSTTGGAYEEERDQVHRAAQGEFEGVILYPTPRTAAEAETDYLRRDLLDFPIVLADMAAPEHGRVQVVFDNYAAGFEATQRLLALGHRRIAFVRAVGAEGELHYITNRDRERGYRDAMALHGAPCDDALFWDLDTTGDVSYESVRRQLEAWRAAGPPTAVLSLEDHHAAQIVHEAQALGIRVPEDLCVVGFDDVANVRFFNQSVPTTTPDCRFAGMKAVELLARLMLGRLAPPLIYMLPVQLTRFDRAVRALSDRPEAVSGAN